MRWIVTGSGGQLGRCLVATLQSLEDEILAGEFDHAALDIGEPGILAASVEGWRDEPPDVVINAAAFTGVDLCESEEARARLINAVAPGQLAAECREAKVDLIHISTDYVFDGNADQPYSEGSAVSPQTAYGRTKLEGEEKVVQALPRALVIRTSWVFGPGKNFVEAILKQAEKRRRGEVSGPLKVVADQRGGPTYARDLAEGIVDLARMQWAPEKSELSQSEIDREKEQEDSAGIFHLANSGETTWFGFARAILDQAGYRDLEVEPLATGDLDLPAQRPAFSVLDCTRASGLGVGLRPWGEALDSYLESRAVTHADGNMS